MTSLFLLDWLDDGMAAPAWEGFVFQGSIKVAPALWLCQSYLVTMMCVRVSAQAINSGDRGLGLAGD